MPLKNDIAEYYDKREKDYENIYLKAERKGIHIRDELSMVKMNIR